MYNPNNLSCLACDVISRFSTWHYRTSDSRKAVMSPGYFNDAWPMVRERDRIHVDAGDASADCMFTCTEEGDVRIAPMTAWVEVPAVVRRAA